MSAVKAGVMTRTVKAKSVFSVFLCSEAVYVVLHVYFCNHLSVIDFGLTHGFKHVICQSQYLTVSSCLISFGQ